MEGINVVKEMKKDFFVDLRKWYKRNWYIFLRHRNNQEAIQKLEFDKMRELYELNKVMTDDEIAEFQIQVLERIQVLWNEMTYQKVTYYSMKVNKRVEFKNLGLVIYYHEIEEGIYEVYDNKSKVIVDENGLKRYLLEKRKEDFRAYNRKSS